MSHTDWRYACPYGHRSYRSNVDGTYYCQKCNNAGRDPKFDEPVDLKREELDCRS